MGVVIMLTPNTINKLIQEAYKKHTTPIYGLYPPHKRIMNYISKRVTTISINPGIDDLMKVKEMTDLLEGFIKYLNNTHKLLRLEMEKILTYIYYPEFEDTTLQNKDNLLLGSKGETIRLWHDAYFEMNRGTIINCLIDCKNILYKMKGMQEHIAEQGFGMPIQMQKKYAEMLFHK
jgi:hypothetical protein